MKKAFSLFELIVVMVVLGILAINAIPRLKRDTRGEAITHMLQVIRYTQDLALHDNKYSHNSSKWQRKFWRFEIRKCQDNGELHYNIGTDRNQNGYLSRNESAIDPSNGKFMFWPDNYSCSNKDPNTFRQVSSNIFIEEKFGINKVEFINCNSKSKENARTKFNYVSFDYYGRVYDSNRFSNAPDNYGLMQQDCQIKFYFKDNSIKPFTIIIPNESSYAYLQENPKL